MNRYERAQALAKTAIGLMAERAVEPSPENFELFFAYASGDNPAVSRVIGDMIAGRKAFTPAVLDDLRKRFFVKARFEEAMDSVGESVAETLDVMLGKLEKAGRDTVDYGKTLSAATGELGTAQSPAGVRKLVDGLIKATHTMEERTKVLENELQNSSREVTELKSKLDDVRKESLTDPLTGIANRKAFDAELNSAIRQARDNQEPLSLLMCDIDHFKRFNDTFGHQTGDHVLRLVANCLSENVKGRDTAARYGGEEFVVIVRGTPLEAAMRLADQIRTGVESKKLVKKSTGDILGTITISIGVAEFDVTEAAPSLIQRADACLYAAKNGGRNCVKSATTNAKNGAAAA
ncbi:MAG: GGDEF domain-containing protein [Pseudomonadota bacterium]|nr:GGDEF domain-containing protein [Pseudomonadota bacterium]